MTLVGDMHGIFCVGLAAEQDIFVMFKIIINVAVMATVVILAK